MLKDLVVAFGNDCRQYPASVALLRAARSLRVGPFSDLRRRFARSSSMRRHLAAVAPSDSLFFISHRHYLARGLSARQRIEAAVAHYEAEDECFDDGYLTQVYERGGLVVWSQEAAGIAYDIRLMPGNDSMQEGGLSMVLHVDGGRVAVMSFSRVPTEMVLPDGPRGGTIPFVTRKQLTGERGYQASFFQAFDHVTPARLLIGAVAGYAIANGHRVILGIAPERHLAWTESLRDRFAAAYLEFWTSFADNEAVPFGYLIDVPFQEKPIEGRDASKRKRSRLRRAHIEAVRSSAQAVIASHLRVSRVRAVVLTDEPVPPLDQSPARGIG